MFFSDISPYTQTRDLQKHYYTHCRPFGLWPKKYIPCFNLYFHVCQMFLIFRFYFLNSVWLLNFKFYLNVISENGSLPLKYFFNNLTIVHYIVQVEQWNSAATSAPVDHQLMDWPNLSCVVQKHFKAHLQSFSLFILRLVRQIVKFCRCVKAI